jgi:glycosyltransferase involved in cell wall biosynthesis
MKLLFIVRRVDKSDAVAGFAYQWINKIAGQVDRLFVICLERGDSDGLPTNVQVYSLGKEIGKNRWRELWRFAKYLSQLVPQVDGIWAHQNPEYTIIGALWARFYAKKIVSWYAHGSVNWKVRLMTALATRVATSSAEGFRLPTKKLVILHQGIDTELFSFNPKVATDTFIITTVGRLTPSKQLETMIDLMNDSDIKSIPGVQLRIIGDIARESDRLYRQTLVERIHALALTSHVQLLPAVPNRELATVYQQADLLINCSKTGSLDKVVLEAMACGTLVLTTNVAFKQMFSHVSIDCFADSSKDLALKIQQISRLTPEERLLLQQQLRTLVVENHDLNDLVKKMVALFNS